MSNFIENLGNFAVILGSQRGDEGKGKLIDILSDKFKYVVRAAGGANAGHTIYIDGKKHVFHLVPSGMLNDGCICIIGNGLALHLPTLMEELELLNTNGIQTRERILVSDRCHLLFEYHKIIDGIQEEMKGDKKVGTTKRGIGPCYTDKIRRNGIRVHELMDFEKFEGKYRENLAMLRKMYGDFEHDADTEIENLKKIAETLKPMIIDSAYYLNSELKNGEKILVEGANGILLDIDHGTYPFVTSSNPSIGGIATGTGLPPTQIKNIIGIMKAYTTRVGSGPFPTELTDELGEQIRESGGEYGATTGRPRRCGWYDSVIGKYSVMINGLTDINLTKLDVLSGLEKLKIGTSYKYKGEYLKSFPADSEIFDSAEFSVEYLELPGWQEDLSKIRNYSDLPENARKYIETIEELIDCKATSIGVGVNRTDIIFR
ncbi:adenylosuccinate synthase [Candidatus Peregrinibacteria bacterium]|nr:adenylosuccinate synthase [Candidatus Peregrinibacteria bacterium]